MVYPNNTLVNATYINEGDDVMYEYGTNWFTKIPKGATVLVQNAGKDPLQGCICLTDDELTAQFNQYYGCHNVELTRPYDGVPALLKRLKAAGMRLAVCSNKADEFSRVIVEHYYPGVFDLVRGNLNGMPVKPDPAAAREILRKLDAVPASSVMVGDSSVDIQTGHNAGIRSCGVTWGFRSRESLAEAGADALADTPEELEKILMG